MQIPVIQPLGFTFLLLMLVLSTGCKDNKQAEPSEVATTTNKSETTLPDPQKKSKNILCFGNSLTAGYGLEDEKDNWTYLLQSRVDSLEMVYNIINAGLSGETTAEGLQRIDWVLSQAVDIFILELGANDMLRGLDVTKTKENLDAILAKVKSKNANIKIVIAGMLAPPSMGADYQKSFDGIYPELATKYDAALIPFFLQSVAQVDALNLPDGKHPNPKGHKIVLENVWKALKGIL